MWIHHCTWNDAARTAQNIHVSITPLPPFSGIVCFGIYYLAWLQVFDYCQFCWDIFKLDINTNYIFQGTVIYFPQHPSHWHMKIRLDPKEESLFTPIT